jgi:hypothetical protein
MQHGVQLKSLFARAKSQQAATAVGSCQAAATQSGPLVIFQAQKSLPLLAAVAPALAN